MFDLIRAYVYNALSREEGQGLTEYALILSLILVGVAAAVAALNTNILTALGNAAGDLVP